MTTLLDNRVHHRCVRILSQKAQELTVLNEEPSRRRTPVVPAESVATKAIGDGLTARQRGQRERWQREKALKMVIHDEVPPDGQNPVICSFSLGTKGNSIQLTIQQRSQRQHRQKERCILENASRKVSVLPTPGVQAC
jgi:hypothetical protein